MQTKTLTFILLIVGVFALPASIALGASITPNPVDQNNTFQISSTQGGDLLIIYDLTGNALSDYNGSSFAIDPQNFTGSQPVLPLGYYLLVEVDSSLQTVSSNASLSTMLNDAGFITMQSFTVEVSQQVATSTGSAISPETDSMIFYFLATALFMFCFVFFYNIFRIFTL